jgi:hypothetical protein
LLEPEAHPDRLSATLLAISVLDRLGGLESCCLRVAFLRTSSTPLGS